MNSAFGIVLAAVVFLSVTGCRDPRKSQDNNDMPNKPRSAVPGQPADPAAQADRRAASARDCQQFMAAMNDFLSRLPDEQLKTALIPFLRGAASARVAADMEPADLRALLTRPIGTIQAKGNRFVLRPPAISPKPDDAGTPEPADAGPAILKHPLFVYYNGGAFRVDLNVSLRYRVPPPVDPSPQNVSIPLDQALAAIPGAGKPVVTFKFKGDIAVRCTLFPDQAPETVAAFISMALGLRNVVTAWPEKNAENNDRSGDAALADRPPEDAPKPVWERVPWYNGMELRKALDGYVLSLGRGKDPGFRIPDEMNAAIRHDSAGLLTTLPDTPENGTGVIGFTSAALPDHDDTGTIFGRCDTDDVYRLFAASAEAGRNGKRLALSDITITRPQ